MKKILILIFLSSQIFANLDSNVTKNSIYLLVEELLEVNKKIDIIANIDQNKTGAEIAALKEQKNSILNKIPLSIIETKIDEKKIEIYSKNRAKFQNRLQITSKNKKSAEYLGTLSLIHI